MNKILNNQYYLPGQKSMIRWDKVRIGIICLIIGFCVGLWSGYAWRYVQTHERHEAEVASLQTKYDNAMQKKYDLETQIGILKGKNKRVILEIKKGVKNEK